MTGRSPRRPPLGLLLLLGLLAAAAAAVLLLGRQEGAGVFTDPVLLWRRILWPILRLTFFISLGLFAGQVIEGLGWTDRLAVTARPFMRRAHLPPPMGAAFTTAFVSGTASLSMLMAFHREGRMSRRELILAVLLNTFPSFFLHLPTTFFVLLPLVGRAGLLYLLLTFTAALVRFVAALAASRLLLPPSEGGEAAAAGPAGRSWRGVLAETAGRFRARIVRILMIVLPVYILVVIAQDAGLFVWLRVLMAERVTAFPIPIEAFSVVLFSLVAEFTSGYAAAGALLESGALTVTQTALALLLGNILAAPVRALRHQLPAYMGIFTPRLGLGLMAASQAFRMLSLALSAGLFLAGLAFLT
jgi:hypothetical protein